MNQRLTNRAVLRDRNNVVAVVASAGSFLPGREVQQAARHPNRFIAATALVARIGTTGMSSKTSETPATFASATFVLSKPSVSP